MALTHYGTLGVPRDATADELRTAYRQQAKLHHPDLGGDGARMAELTVAHAVVGDAAKRRAYDAMLALYGTQCAACGGKGRTYRQKGFTARTSRVCVACDGEGVTAVSRTVASIVSAGPVKRTARKRK